MPSILLYSKLLQPKLRPLFVQRNALLRRLAAGHQGKLTLVSAPAGSGKTTVIADFVGGLPSTGRCAWLSLDEADNDPVRFLAYVIAALQTAVPTLGDPARSLLATAHPPALETVLILLCNDISRFDGRLTLVLDDYHAISNLAVHQAVAFWLEHLPPNLHLILTTRADPPLPLSRLRVRGELNELRAADLRFRPEEAATFLRLALDVELSAEAIGVLEERTEGWIAGLQLAALSMQGQDDLPGFIQAFAGSHAYILDYLVDEVLRQQPDDVVRFLQETAILEHLNAALCAAVTGRADSDILLRQLYQSNLFLETLDDRREWFRFHPLFRDVLSLQLQNTSPQQIPTLHGRASDWYAQSGQVTPALAHALAAGDFHRAAGIVENYAWETFAHGEMQAVRGWLDALPSALIQSRPWLALIQANVLVTTGQVAAATEAIAALKHGPEPVADAAFAGELVHLEAIMARFQGGNMAAVRLAEKALGLLPAARTGSRAAALLNLAMAHIASGNTAAAGAALTAAEIVDAGSQIARGAQQGLAWLHVRQGHLEEAERIYRNSIVQMAGSGDGPVPTAGAAYAGLAEVLLARYALTEARTTLKTGIELLRGSVEQILLALAYGRLGQVELALGDASAARAALAEAEEWLAQMRLHDLGFGRIVAGYRAWLALRQGNLLAATDWVRESNLLPDIYLDSIRELLYPILVRVLLANHEFANVQSILDALNGHIAARHWHGQMVEIQLLQALLHHAQNDSVAAQAALQRALELGAAQGNLFCFVDEGQPLATLLRQLDEPPGGGPFVSRLRFLLERGPADVAASALPEALSRRELEVLQLVAAGATNREIADQLVIAVPTVKKHLTNIFAKLDAGNRTQAIGRARASGLIH